jgi:hypothetical protein
VGADDSLAEWHRPAHQRPHGRRWPRRLLIAAGATLAVTALLGFVVAAPVVRHIARKQLGELLGRRVTVSRVRVNPFALSLTIEGLEVFEADGRTPFLGLSRFYVKVGAVSLLRRCLVVRELRFESLRGRVVRDKGATIWPGSVGDYNFSDIVARLSRPSKPAEASEPARGPRFSLANIQILDGSVTYEDRPSATRHEIAGLSLRVPLLSTLPTDGALLVKPALTAQVDGAPFAIGGRVRPFGDSVETAAELRVSALDLAGFLPYLPVRLPVDVSSALLSLDLDVFFACRHQSPPRLTVQGRVTVERIAVRNHQGSPLVRIDTLQVRVEQADLFAEQLAFEKVAIVGAELHIRRLRDGTLDWQRLIEAARRGVSQDRQAAPKTGDGPRPHFEIAELTLEQATAHLRDESVRPRFDLTVAPLALSARNLSNAPGSRSEVTFELRARPGGTVKERGTLSLDPLAASGTVTVDGLELAGLAPYCRAQLGLDVPAGRMRLTTGYRFEQRRKGSRLAFSDGVLEVANLVVRQVGAADRKPILRLKTLSLHGATVDLGKRTVSIGSVRSRDGQLRIVRDRQAHKGAGTATTAPTPEPVAAPWSFTVDHLDVDRWSADFEDRSVRPPVVWSASPLTIQASGLGTGPGVRSVVDLRTGLGARGQIALKATGSINPVAAELRFDLRGIDLPSFQPYVAPYVSFAVTKGAISASGQARLVVPPSRPGRAASPPKIDLAANLEVASLAALDAREHEPLVDWGSLRVGGLALSTLPFRLVMDDIGLDDFAARLVRRADKTWNVGPTSSGSSGATGPITIGRLTLRGGRFGFVDRSLSPSFATELGDIAARLSASFSGAGSEVSGALSGRVDDFAPLTVAGMIRLADRQPSADWKLELRDLDLPPASPYAGKYLGYLIEKGKLDLAVACHIVRGKLATDVRLVVNKLALGPRTESPNATGVNVPRTIALLKDRHGVINLDLPITGSFTDRKFALGQTVRNALLGVFTKAAALPFDPILSIVSLVDGGRSEERASVDFQPGQAALDPEGVARIDGWARALREGTNTSIEIEGHADPARDGRSDGASRLAWRRAFVVRDALARAQPGTGPRLFLVLPKVATGAGNHVELRLKKN